jgi:small conductance mechanosensitive channel
VEVRVQEGVAFLHGRSQSEQYRKWADDLARNTRDVAVVVNQMDVVEPPVWDFQPAIASLRELGRGSTRALPLVAFGGLIWSKWQAFSAMSSA